MLEESFKFAQLWGDSYVPNQQGKLRPLKNRQNCYTQKFYSTAKTP